MQLILQEKGNKIYYNLQNTIREGQLIKQTNKNMKKDRHENKKIKMVKKGMQGANQILTKEEQ